MLDINQPKSAFVWLPDFICVGLWGRLDEDCAANACPLGGGSLDINGAVSIMIALMQSQRGLARAHWRIMGAHWRIGAEVLYFLETFCTQTNFRRRHSIDDFGCYDPKD